MTDKLVCNSQTFDSKGSRPENAKPKKSYPKKFNVLVQVIITT